MTCDHDASRASLRVFLASTDRHKFQDFGDTGETLLLGNCKGCTSTLAVPIDLARGSIVKGEIVASEPPPRSRYYLDEPPPVRETAQEPETFEQLAARVIK